MKESILSQKEMEKIFLSNFLKYYSNINHELNNYKIINEGESPDFLIESQKITYAIEITEYFKGNLIRSGGSIERIDLSKKEKILNRTQLAFESKSSKLLTVNVIWSQNDFTKLDNKTINKIADVFSDKLIEIIPKLDSPYIYSFNNIDEFVKNNILKKYISWINISYKISFENSTNAFYFSESDYLEDSISKLIYLINEKDNKFESYTSNLTNQNFNYNKFWLIIDANGRHLSSTCNFEQLYNDFKTNKQFQSIILKSKFDNIFIYDSYYNKFFQIK